MEKVTIETRVTEIMIGTGEAKNMIMIGMKKTMTGRDIEIIKRILSTQKENMIEIKKIMNLEDLVIRFTKENMKGEIVSHSGLMK